MISRLHSDGKNERRPCLEQGVLAAGHDQAEEQHPHIRAEAPVQGQKPEQRHQDDDGHGQHVFLDVFRSAQSKQIKMKEVKVSVYF